MTLENGDKQEQIARDPEKLRPKLQSLVVESLDTFKPNHANTCNLQQGISETPPNRKY